jgi:8-oxo-dGTP diphosphatase
MAHIHDKIDFTADVFIVHKNRVLLRKHDKYKIWLGVGGHIELDEDPNLAVMREAKEEAGLDIILFDSRLHSDFPDNSQELIPPLFINRHRINDTHEHISFIYVATTKSKKITNEGREKSDDMRWFTAEELKNPDLDMLERVRFYAGTALEKLAK